jgi:F0F1-type ATP synthase assembly protein I
VVVVFKYFFLTQGLVALAGALLIWLYSGNPLMPMAWLAGTLCSIVPTLVFAASTIRYRGASKANLIVSSIYRGEALKIGLVILGLALGFRLLEAPLHFTFFAGFILTYTVNFAAPLLIGTWYRKG